MLFLLIFPILVAGFLACHIHPYHSYKLHRYEGQYLYLKSSKLGLMCFGWGFLLATTFHLLVPSSVQIFGFSFSINIEAFVKDLMGDMGASNDSEKAKMAWFFILSVATIFSAWIIKLWGHIVLKLRFGHFFKNKVHVIGELLDDSPLDSLLFKLSLNKNKQVMLSMQDRKVYVGKIIRMGEPTETNGMDQDITIVPVLSGYRDKDTLKVKLDTEYNDMPNSKTNITLSLRQDAIVSATEFDFDFYDEWHKPNVKKLYTSKKRRSR